MKEKSFKTRIISALSWTMGGHIFSQLLRLGSNLIMTRLLVPEMFGVMVIANTIMIGLILISDMGLNQHIIQSKKSDSEDFLNTAWVVQIIRGVVIWILAGIISLLFIGVADSNLWPPTSVYADEQLPYIIAIISLSAVIGGFQSTKWAMASRNLVIDRVVKIEVVAQIAGLIFMIAWAYINRTIWALVFGSLLTVFLKTISSHIFLEGHNNKFYFDKKIFYELFHFGKWIFLTSIVGFLALNSDKIILAGLVDANLLGIYTIAIFIIAAIRNVISKLINTVAFPVLSEVLRDREGDIKHVYYKIRTRLDIGVFFLVGFLFVTGETIIDILYDDRYLEAGMMLKILSIMLLAERYSLTNQFFIAKGKPSLLVPILLLRVVFLYVSLPISYAYYGLEGAIWSISLSAFVSLPFVLYLKLRYSILDIKKELYPVLFLAPGYYLGIGIINIIA